MADKEIQQQAGTSQAPRGRVLGWEAPEFIAHERTWLWHVVVWLIGIGLAAAAFWYYGVTLFGGISAAAALSAAIALSAQASIKPKQVRVGIDERGVTLNGQLHSWEELKGFWVVYSEQNQATYLETTRAFLAVVRLPLGKMDPETVRRALLEHLPEHDDRAEDMSDRISRFIKF